MTEEICTSIAFVLAAIAIILRITNKDKNISGLKPRHIDEISDGTWDKQDDTNEKLQTDEDSSQIVSVVLISVPDKNKIEVLKEIREITYMGLKEAKDIIELTPSIIKENVSIAEAKNIKNILEKVGAKIELR